MDVKSGANDRHNKNVTIVASGIIRDGGQFKTDRSFWDYSLSNYRSAENPGWIYNDNALFVTADQIWVHVFNKITSAQNVYARACTLPLYTLAEFKDPVFCIISAMWKSATITKKKPYLKVYDVLWCCRTLRVTRQCCVIRKHSDKISGIIENLLWDQSALEWSSIWIDSKNLE